VILRDLDGIPEEDFDVTRLAIPPLFFSLYRTVCRIDIRFVICQGMFAGFADRADG
jgi:hypothetical protein